MRSSIGAILILISTAAWSGPTPAEQGWVALFNGRDLSGWVKNGQEKWVVENGAILGESTVGHYGYLTTKKTFSNFELKLKFNPENGNSGVFTRSRITGDSPKTGPDIQGEQVEVDPTRNTGSIYESGGRGWIAMGTPECEHAIKPRDWNDLEISEVGRHYVTRLNGVPCVDFTDAPADSGGASKRHALIVTDGVIGLQLHTGGGVKIRFKDIYVRPLP